MVKEKEIIMITRGVKQGGVLSPQLFNFYINELISTVESLEFGCRVNGTKISILGYCDDMLTASLTINNMKTIIETCVEFGKKWLVKFNAKKSVIMNCGKKVFQDSEIEIKMEGKVMPVMDACKYLGIIIDTTKKDDVQVIEKYK